MKPTLALLALLAACAGAHHTSKTWPPPVQELLGPSEDRPWLRQYLAPVMRTVQVSGGVEEKLWQLHVPEELAADLIGVDTIAACKKKFDAGAAQCQAYPHPGWTLWWQRGDDPVVMFLPGTLDLPATLVEAKTRALVPASEGGQ